MFFLEFPCFLYNPANVGNLISGSSSFSKSSLDSWKFLVCIMLKPNKQNFFSACSRRPVFDPCVWFLPSRKTLEEEVATHPSILAWRISWTEESGRGLHWATIILSLAFLDMASKAQTRKAKINRTTSKYWVGQKVHLNFSITFVDTRLHFINLYFYYGKWTLSWIQWLESKHWN